jgi:hypothetical protein
MSATAAAFTLVGKKPLEQLATDLYGLAKEKLGSNIKNWRAKNHADLLFKQIKQIKMVKTIWQMERAVDINTFYCPTKVWVKNKRTNIHQIADLGYDGNILIEGSLGQGKSIFLRYLSMAEYALSKRIPIFIELRKIKPSQKLLSYIVAELGVLGFEATERLFKLFASEGKLILMLDAFDEVREELRQDLLFEIEDMLRENENLRAVVTSRADSGVAPSSAFTIFRICELRDREYETVIQKMATDKENADIIIKGIRKESAQLAKVLTSPLMVALLMVRYKIDQSLPQNDAAFYDSIFTLLLQRHDKSKPGYTRPRKSKLSDSQLLDFFNTFCFSSRREGDGSFSDTALAKYAKSTLKVMGIDGAEDDVISDIVQITCLLLKEGDEYKFVHKSVQEYHAACFIRSQAQEFAIKFYSKVQSAWRNWFQELRFLRLIDEYRFLKYFHIPQIDTLTGEIDPKSPTDLFSAIFDICGSDALETRKEPNFKQFVYYGSDAHWITKIVIND